MDSNDHQQRLAAQFDQHVEEEGRILQQYRCLGEKISGGTVGFMIDSILAEEEMHHLMLRTMGKWLRDPDSAKDESLLSGEERAEMQRLTEELARHEFETVQACRKLKDELYEGERDLLGTLLDAMVLDSEKHHRLLSAIAKML